MKRRNHRVVRLLATAVTAATLAAPVNAAAGSGGKSPVEPTSPEPSNAILRNDIAHFGNQQGLSDPNAQPGSPAPIVVRVDGGFDWVSAGVGAAGGVGLVLVAGAATSTLRHRHRADRARA
jgi:hypothetical protein